MGKEYYRLKRYTDAVREYQTALEEVRDNAWIWYRLGKALQALGRAEESEQAYNQSLALDPDMGRFVFQRLEDSEDSIQLLKDMIEEEPGNPAVWLSLGELYREIEDYHQAEATLAEAWRLFPDRAEVAFTYGKTLMSAEKLEDALVPLRFAATTLEDPLAAWKELGDLHYELGQYDQAVEAFTRARVLDPEDGRYCTIKKFSRSTHFTKARVENSIDSTQYPARSTSPLYSSMKPYDKKDFL